MSLALRGLGAIVLLAGLVAAAIAGFGFATDAQYHEVAAAYARHPTHALFQADYWLAAARHWGLLAAAVAGLVVGLVAGALLTGVGEVLRRLPR